MVLLGRTGNNLFQYALGRVLSEKHDVPLVLDASWFNAEGWKEVSHFLKLPLKAKVIRRFSIGSRVLRNIAGKHYWEYRGVPILREANGDQSFDKRFLNAPKDCMLFGYFQSPIYFKDIADSLRAELNDLIAGAVSASQLLVRQVTIPNSVAVHVRRQDYLKIPAFQVCDSSYYHIAIHRLRERLPGARFHIFSDDPEWCRGEFREDDEEIIDSGNQASNPLYDLHLMSLASHHIISNSSYSWWAAWLGEKAGQQVLMPDRWYSGDIKAPIEEKLCKGWETVPTSLQ